MHWSLKGVGVGSAVLSLAIALSQHEIAARVDPARKTSPAKRVTELFNRNCARCHGGDGRGNTPLGRIYKTPDFTDPKWWQDNSKITNVRTMRSIVTRGKAGMPAFGKKLTRSEINLLVDRIRKFKPLERKN